jgi:predicted DsbA family dithiol-disulfide isomerase
MMDDNGSDAAERRRPGTGSPPGGVLEVEVWFDFVCPWCFIGKRNLATALQTLASKRPGTPVALQWHPHPLLPETPADGLSFAEFYRERLGSDAAVALRQAEVQDAARRAGTTIAFDRIQVLPTTLPAHRLALQAQDEVHDGGKLAGAVIEALFREYFILGQDIGQPSVLQAIAARCRVMGDPDATPLPKSAPTAQGVPFFRFGGIVSVVGAQPPEVLLAAMEQVLDARGESAPSHRS